MSKKSGIGKFLLGLGIGAGLGVLFAPKKGSETRAELKQKLDDLVAKVKEIDPSEVKEELERKISEIKEELADLDKEKALSIAKSKAKAIARKTDELVKIAVDKCSPVVNKAANDITKIKNIFFIIVTLYKF